MTKEELMKIFSRKLERLLVDRKKSQADMARYMRVSSATASEWVNGKKIPRADSHANAVNTGHKKRPQKERIPLGLVLEIGNTAND